MQQAHEESDPRTLLQQGIAHHRAGRLPEAERAYRGVLAASPGEPDALHLLGLLAGQAGQPAAGIEMIKEAIERRPDVPAFHANLAAMLERAGRPAEAEFEARRALRLSPEHPTALITLANSLCALERHDDSIAIYVRATALKPDDVALWSNYGTALGVLGRHPESAEALSRAVRLAPGHAGILANLAGALRQSGRRQEAAEAYARALEMEPGLTSARVDLGRLRLEAGDPAAAVVELERALKARPGDIRALAALETARRQIGDIPGADRLLDCGRFLVSRQCAPPADYATLADFDAALARHVLAHPTLRPEPPSKTTRGGSQTRELLDGSPGPIAALEAMIRDAVQSYLEALPEDAGHEWTAARPSAWKLTLWATVLETEGRQDPHVHPSGWLSGVYYVQVPPPAEGAGEQAGWIEFGRPPDAFHGTDVARLQRIEPLEGRLLLFPSYFYHCTVPFAGAGLRISIAFDVVPVQPGDDQAEEVLRTTIPEIDRLLDAHYTEAAERLARRLHDQLPDEPWSWHIHGKALHRCGRYREAAPLLSRALERMPDSPLCHLGYGVHLAETGQVDDARKHLRRVLELSRDESTWYAVGRAYANLGLKDEAMAAYGRIVAARADAGHALYAMATLVPPAADDARFDQMRIAATSEAAHAHEQAAACFALGAAFEKLGEYAEAFQWFRRANEIRRAELPFDVAALRQEFALIRAGFPSSVFDRDSPGEPTGLPLFVVGMPRSGTTLLEQILDCHPEIAGAGELSEIRSLALRLQDRMPQGRYMPRDAAHVPASAWRDAGRQYLAAVRQRAGDARRLVDKQPFNYMYVGPIRLMLPGSRIVHAVRDPRDTCLSMYCIGFAGVPGFAYDLSDLGEVYRLYWELMEHWREVVPEAFLDVRYESLVTEPEPQIRRLLEHAGVEWNTACLDFHSNARAVSTASRAQVRQPMYRSSVGRWKAYANELAPLLEKLEPVLARIGAA